MQQGCAMVLVCFLCPYTVGLAYFTIGSRLPPGVADDCDLAQSGDCLETYTYKVKDLDHHCPSGMVTGQAEFAGYSCQA